MVIDKDEYQEKVSVLLNDTNTYLKITDKRSNPTSSVEKDLNKLLLKAIFLFCIAHPYCA